MARVFVSHAGDDAGVAHTVFGWLLDDGHEVFLDRDPAHGIEAGDEWEARLHERLRWADAVVCLVTDAYVRSLWCAGEVAVARSRGCVVLPLRLHPGVTHPFLTSVQLIDLPQGVDVGQGMNGVRLRLAAALSRLDMAGGRGWPDDLSPFPGLRPFTVRERRAFFGRRDEIAQLTGLIRSPAERAEEAVLLVVGPSGCGKSSLVRAGLQPAVADEPDWWTVSVASPGAAPASALARELTAAARLVGLPWSASEVRDRVDDGRLSELVDDLLLAVPGRGRRRLLLVVDQLEELLTQASPGERQRFAELLRPVLGRSTRVVATMRAEFLDRLLTDPALATLPARVHTLAPLRREALAAVITEPARLAGLSITDDLVTKMVADTDAGEALPLLAYTLAQLSDGVPRGGALSAERYRRLGGVHGTLAQQADAALADAVAAGGRTAQDVIAALLRLVTVDELHRPTRWRVDRADLSPQAAAELDAFVARRLLTTDWDGGRATISVAHEAFLSAWAPLADAVTGHSAALRTRRLVEQAATEWVDGGRPPTGLWERGQLAGAMSTLRVRRSWRTQLHRRRWSLPPWLLVPEQVTLIPAAREFLLASIHRDVLRRSRATATLTVLLVAAVVGAGVAVDRQGAAVEQQRTATARLLLAQADAARPDDPATALRLNLAAQTVHPDADTRAALVNALTSGRFATRLVPPGGGPVRSVAAAGDRLAAAVGDNVVVWAASDPLAPRPSGAPLECRQGGVTSLAFDGSGRLLATAGVDGTLAVWVLDPGASPHRTLVRTGHTGALRSVAFAPDGRTLAAGGTDDTVSVWDVTDPGAPQHLATLTDHRSDVNAVAFTRDGRAFVTGGDGASGLLWDLTDSRHPQRVGPLLRQLAAIAAAAFSPDGTTLALALADGTTQLWNVADRAAPYPVGGLLTGHTERASSVTYSPDGRLLAIASADATTSIWDVSTPDQPQRVDPPTAGHSGAVLSVAFDRTGRVLTSASDDGSLALWDLDDPNRPRRLDPGGAHPGGVSAVTFVGPTLAATTTDGAVSLWNTTLPRPQGRDAVTGRTEAINAVTAAPSGSMIAAAGEDGHVDLWDLRDPANPRLLGSAPGTRTSAVWGMAFSPDGRMLATVGADRRARLWDVTAAEAPRPLGATPEQSDWLVAAAFAPDRPTLATAGLDEEVVLWDVADPAAPRPLGRVVGAHTGSVNALAFAPGGRVLATAGDDGTVLLWGVDDTAPQRVGEIVDGHVGAVNAIAFSPDGGLLVTVGDDHTGLIWDVTDSEAPRRIGSVLIGHAEAVSSVAIAADGRSLATGGRDGAVMTWSLDRLNRIRAEPAKFACRVVGRSLDPAEWTVYVYGLDYEDPCRT